MPDSSAPRRKDTDPVGEAEVAAFLDWYRVRVTVPTYSWIPELWLHALQTLQIQELRSGMRAFDRLHRGRGYVGPVRFWGLCRDGRIPETDWRRFVPKQRSTEDADLD